MNTTYEVRASEKTGDGTEYEVIETFTTPAPAATRAYEMNNQPHLQHLVFTAKRVTTEGE